MHPIFFMLIGLDCKGFPVWWQVSTLPYVYFAQYVSKRWWFQCGNRQHFLHNICNKLHIYIYYTRVLNGPENYDPTRPSLWVSKPEPNTPIWIVCPNRARTRHALFSSYTCYCNFTQWHKVCVCPSPWSRQPDLLFITCEQRWFTEQTIYNSQPARNAFAYFFDQLRTLHYTLLRQGYPGLWRWSRSCTLWRSCILLFCLHHYDKGTGNNDGSLKHGSHLSLANSCHMGTDNLSQVILICDLQQVSHSVFPYWFSIFSKDFHIVLKLNGCQ